MKPLIFFSLSLALLPTLTLSTATTSQAQVVVERVTNENGVYRTCGEGDGLNPCRDFNGETYDEEIRGQSVESESSSELAAEAARLRNESPQEREQSIEDMEQGYNP
jgi:hypothetical protein